MVITFGLDHTQEVQDSGSEDRFCQGSTVYHRSSARSRDMQEEEL